jgi:pimeloyl-ACP methyl ester carboxylesterase
MTVSEFPFAPPSGPPARQRLLLEALAGKESIRLPFILPSLLKRKATHASTILLVPGLGATDASMIPLRTYLRRLGHDARSVGMGRISDDVEGQYVRVAAAAVRLAAEVDKQVVLIGWSIGGVLVREAARDHQDLVRRVITFGTPVVGGPAYSQVALRYSKATLDAIVRRVNERAVIPMKVPITAIWSRLDGIVDPAACFDRTSGNVEHVEVNSTHFGMGIDPDVWRVIADRLSAASPIR